MSREAWVPWVNWSTRTHAHMHTRSYDMFQLVRCKTSGPKLTMTAAQLSVTDECEFAVAATDGTSATVDGASVATTAFVVMTESTFAPFPHTCGGKRIQQGELL